MAIRTTAGINRDLDGLVSLYLRTLSVAAQTYGVGASGASDRAAGRAVAIRADLLAAADADVSLDLLPGAQSMVTLTDALRFVGPPARALLSRYNTHARRLGGANYSNLDSLLTYFNAGLGGTWQNLQNPNLRDIWNAAFGGSNYPAVNNLYFEVLQGATYAVGLGGFLVTGAGTGTFTDAGLVGGLLAGGAIDTSKYAGGVPAIVVSGITGSGNVTVTGTGFDPSTKAATGSVTWVFNATGNGRFYRSGGTAPTNALIANVTGVAVVAGISAGQIYVEAERPAVYTATATAGASTTVTLPASPAPETQADAYTGYQIGHSGDRYTWRTISSFNPSTRVVTVSSSWATNPTASDTVRILRPQLP